MGQHQPILMAGLHATPGTSMPWAKQAIDLAANLKTVGCRHFKIQQNLDGLDDEASIQFLKRTIVSGHVMYDAKVKDASSTMSRYIKRLVGYGVDWVTVWLDESGLPEIERLVGDYPELLPHLCGVIELTTTPLKVTQSVHKFSRDTFMARHARAATQIGIRNFVCAIPEAAQLRADIARKVPDARITFFCPGLREDDESAGGQVLTGTAKEAIDARVDFVISERAIADEANPRFAYTGIRDRLK